MPRAATKSAPAPAAAPVEAPAAAVAEAPPTPPPITRPQLVAHPNAPPRQAPPAPTAVEAALAALPPDATQEQVIAALGMTPAGAAPAAPADDGEPPILDPAAAVDPNRPEWLDPRYKTVEDQAKAYKDLEKLLGKKAGEPLSVKPKPGEEPPFVLTRDVMKDLAGEWIAEGGKLKDETYAKLAKIGITKEFADRYGQLEQASRDAHRDALLKEQGLTGAAFDELAAWAQTGLKPDEIEAVEAMFQSDNPAQHRMGLIYLKNAHAKANKPQRMAGAPAGSTSMVPIRAAADFRAATADPRFVAEGPAGDAYRKEVFARCKVGGYSPG